MTPEQRIEEWKLYDTQKGRFGFELYKAMAKDEKVWLVAPDLGYGLFDDHFKDFPNRAIRVGASEQAALGIAVGLALEGKTPFIYSIPNFIFYRGYEWVRNYIDHEKIPVQLVGGGRGSEYAEDGFTHQSEDLPDVLKQFKNIQSFWPEDKKEVPVLVREMIKNRRPSFLSLRRKA